MVHGTTLSLPLLVTPTIVVLPSSAYPCWLQSQYSYSYWLQLLLQVEVRLTVTVTATTDGRRADGRRAGAGSLV